MAGFSDVLGHEQTILHMKHAVQMNKVSHAYKRRKGVGAEAFSRDLCPDAAV